MDNQDSNISQQEHQGESSLSLIDILYLLKKNLHWFILGVLIAWTVAYVYLRYTPNVYSASSKVLIKEDPSNIGSELSVLTSRGLVGSDYKPSIVDQVEIFQSRRLIGKVVQNLQLNIRYFTEGRVKTRELFQEESAVKVSVLTKDYTPMDFEVLIKSKSEIHVISNGTILKTSFGKTLNFNGNEIIILPQNPDRIRVNSTTRVSIISMDTAISIYKGSISVSPLKEGSVVMISMVDYITDRATLVIDELVNQYSEDAITDKRLVGEKTTQFIEDRLEKVSQDLELSDREVEGFKKGNKMVDLGSEGGISLSESSRNRSLLLNQSNQLNMANYMEDYLKENKNELIPVNIGLTDGAVNANVGKYNELILARMDMLNYSTETSSIIRNLDEKIKEVETNLFASLGNYKKTLQITLNQIEREEGQIASKIQIYPTQEKEFKGLSRQQQIIESLYLFLLQKREENEITNAVTPSPIKVVDYAFSSKNPVSPKKKIIYLMATAIGVVVPYGILYLLFLLNTKVQSRRDLEKTGISVIGEIPNMKKLEIIQKNDQSFFAEAFRILRTNINFYFSGKKEGSKNIYVTSTLSGEGKTIISVNLALILAAAKKYRVLLLGADIRHPKILKVLDKKKLKKHKGLTEYLSDSQLNLNDILITDNEHGIDVIHAGTIPPNPAELLMNGRLQELLDEANSIYDYIIIDTAPVGLVADTQLSINKADLVLYVVRFNYLDKRLLQIPIDLHKNMKIANITLLPNDVKEGSGGYGYGYGYRYGYRYGYGYGVNQPRGWKKYVSKWFGSKSD